MILWMSLVDVECRQGILVIFALWMSLTALGIVPCGMTSNGIANTPSRFHLVSTVQANGGGGELHGHGHHLLDPKLRPGGKSGPKTTSTHES